MLNEARTLANIPFIINSACRCIVHNSDVGGSKDSAHISTNEKECTAIDIKTINSRTRSIIVDALIKAKFTRIGISEDFIHADTDRNKSQKVMWLY